jgi:hypothetical protein
VPESRPRKRPKNQPQQARPQQKLESKHSMLHTIVEWSLGIMTVIGTVVGLVVFLPRVTVDIGELTDPSNAYTITFVITNAGIIPLKNVQPILGIGMLISGPPQIVPDGWDGPFQSRIKFTPWLTKWMAADEKYEIRLDDAIHFGPNVKFGGAHISIGVEYQPWFLPLTRTKEFRFFTRLEPNGRLTWVRAPLKRK